MFVVEREEVHSSFESKGDTADRQLISLSPPPLLLLLLECARVPTSYSSNSVAVVVVVVDGGFSGNADISSTI